MRSESFTRSLRVRPNSGRKIHPYRNSFGRVTNLLYQRRDVGARSAPEEPRRMLVFVYTVLSTILLSPCERKGMTVCVEDKMRVMVVQNQY